MALRLLIASESMVAPILLAFLMARYPYIRIDIIKIDIDPYFEIITSLEIG